MKDFLNEEIEPGDILLHINLTKYYKAPHIVIATDKITKTERLTVSEFYNGNFVQESFEPKSLIKIIPEKLKDLLLEKGYSFCNINLYGSRTKHLNDVFVMLMTHRKKHEKILI